MTPVNNNDPIILLQSPSPGAPGIRAEGGSFSTLVHFTLGLVFATFPPTKPNSRKEPEGLLDGSETNQVQNYR